MPNTCRGGQCKFPKDIYQPIKINSTAEQID